MDGRPLTDKEKAQVEQYAPIVYQLRDRVQFKGGGPRSKRCYDIEDVTQAGFVELMEAMLAWPTTSRRHPTLKLEAFLTVRIKQAMLRFQIAHSRAAFIPAIQLLHARKPPKHGMMSDETRAKLLGGGRARPLRAALIRWGVRRGACGRRTLNTRQGGGPPEWLNERARLRAAIVETASRYSGLRGDAADLLIAERIPVASKAHRTT